MELQPESRDQPTITPTQFILHSIAAPWDEQRIYEYWRDSTNLESHFGLDFDGSMGQFLSTTTKADANYQANARAVSIETASNLEHTDPWTEAQVEQLIRLGVWLHQTHGIPLRVCRSWDDPGYGYHALYREWSTSGTACPGAARIRQFRERVFPGIVARATGQTTNEDDMTPDQIAEAPLLYRGLDGRQRPVESNLQDFLNNFIQAHARIEAALAAQSAVMQALVAQLGQAHGVDTASVIAAIEDAAGRAVSEYLAGASITFHGGPAAPTN
jgi:hypothetical protein